MLNCLRKLSYNENDSSGNKIKQKIVEVKKFTPGLCFLFPLAKNSYLKIYLFQ